VKATAQGRPFLEWAADDVDGSSRNLTEFMKEAWRLSKT
jgi:hypothetical protein